MNTLLKHFLTFQAVALSALLAVNLIAQEPKAPAAPADPAPPPAATATPAPAASNDTSASQAPAATTTAQTPVEAATPAPAAAAPAAEPPLRSLDGSSVPAPAANAEPSSPQPRRSRSRGPLHSDGNERVAIGHDVELRKDEKASNVVSIFGSITVDGEVTDEAVAILGDARVTGPVRDQVVAVMGDVYVNSKVGSITSVMGDIELGPDAVVDHDVVSVGGEVRRDPKAVVRGTVNHVAAIGSWGNLEGLRTWFTKCAMLGRPLAFDSRLNWAWGIAGAFLIFYMLLALLFRRGIETCAVTLETRPGSTVLASILTLLLSPVAIVLLSITVIGLVVVPFLAAGLFFASLFGKAVMLAWIGRRFTKFFGEGPLAHPVFAVFIGGIIAVGLYTIPVFGFFAYKLFGWLGVGAVVYTIVLRSKRDRPEPAPPAPGVSVPAPFVGTAPATSSGFGGDAPTAARVIDPGMLIGALPSTPPTPVPAPLPVSTPSLAPPPVVAATLPRASLWIRLGALTIDFALIVLLLAFGSNLVPRGFHYDPFPGGIMLALAIYGAVLWKLKGTTIGGIVCGLKIVRTDNREIDWATAIVRALSCFLSLFVGALGFIWIAVDSERQSWHDKIAGTVVVRLPKGVPLV